MRSPHYFIAKPIGGNRYSNTKSIGGLDLIVSTSEEDHKFSNREAEVIETPIGYEGPIKKGDILLVHHNVFKYYNDMKGRRQSGKSFFKDDMFFIEPDQFFMYKSDSRWMAHDRFCFVEPIPPQDCYIVKPMSEEPLMGKMLYPNEYLRSMGLKKGDVVGFDPEVKYEFNVDGKKMYRLYDHQITLAL
ncbi:MAG: hypothetical protein JSW41_05180 [Candidatus Aenigmatarchaeota archaeon]|jgi:hypothetical protein|nr:MAG: hypothetical protein JSW41_05180 [Candidatus Aenigmarchaeota archaeon]